MVALSFSLLSTALLPFSLFLSYSSLLADYFCFVTRYKCCIIWIIIWRCCHVVINLASLYHLFADFIPEVLLLLQNCISLYLSLSILNFYWFFQGNSQFFFFFFWKKMISGWRDQLSQHQVAAEIICQIAFHPFQMHCCDWGQIPFCPW